MNWKQVVLLSGALTMGSIWAEETAPNPPQAGGDGAKAGADNNGNREGRGGERGRGRGMRGGNQGQGGQGQGQGGGPGGPGGPGGFGRFQQQISPEQAQAAAARMAGVDLDDSKTEANLDNLPYGTQRRFITQVPVGGIDSFSPMAQSYKVEQMYKLTFEQTNSLQTVRDEYKAELKKLQDEMTAQQKAMADKVKELRTKYEQRANDVLTGQDKENKQKVDTIVNETHAQNSKLASETFGDNKDTRKMFQLGGELRDKAAVAIEAAQRKIADLVSPEGKAIIEEDMKKEADQRERMKQWMDRAGNRGGPNGGERGGEKGGEAVKPPKAPEQNGNF